MTRTAKNPLVTVLMPVYNAGATVAEAIESILDQSFTDFEFLIIDDGSTDGSSKVIKSYNDPRIVLESNSQNLGVVKTLNKGLQMARGVYVARMDGDDVSLPGRLAAQVAFLDRHPSIGACGTWVETFGDRPGQLSKFPCRPEDIKAYLLFYNVLVHASVCLRREAFVSNNLFFDERFPHAEDFELWQRASKIFPLANIGKILLKHRIHTRSVTQANRAAQAETMRRIDRISLLALGIDATPADIMRHRCIVEGHCGSDEPTVSEAEQWLLRLLQENETTEIYPARSFRLACGRMWSRYCHRAQMSGRGISMHFLKSPLTRYTSFEKTMAILLHGIWLSVRRS